MKEKHLILLLIGLLAVNLAANTFTSAFPFIEPTTLFWVSIGTAVLAIYFGIIKN